MAHDHTDARPAAVTAAASGHRRLSHDSIDGLGFDWSRVADPDVEPQHPFKVYLPRSTEDVARAVGEARELGHELVFRGQGHSSNDLVLAGGGAVVAFQTMNRIGAPDPAAGTITIQAGASVFEVDRQLQRHALGLPVVGDHRHLTAGGFASVGGVSPASHRYGLFVDNVEAITYVTHDGDVAHCSRSHNSEQLKRLLTGRGQHGAITELTLDVIEGDKDAQLLENDRRVVRDFDAFLALATERTKTDPRLQRGYWVDLPRGEGAFLGQWSDFVEISATPAKWGQRHATKAARSALSSMLRSTPPKLERMAKMVGVGTLVLTPKYVTVHDVEVAADRAVDYSIGDPIRWFAAWIPLQRIGPVLERIYRLFRDHRARTGCFSFIAALTQAVRSPYLGGPSHTGTERPTEHAVVLVVCGVRPQQFNREILSALVTELDDICIEEGALRYLHSITSKDPKRESQLDPNTPYRAR